MANVNVNKTCNIQNDTQNNILPITHTNINSNNQFGSRNNIKFIQINLHHAKAATAILHKKFIHSNLDVALIQEPWVLNSRVLGIPTSAGQLIYDTNEIAPRAAILVSFKTKVLPVTEFIKRDIVVILMEVPTTRGRAEIYVASAYFPGDLEANPPPDVVDFVSYCRRNNKPFILGCDANAHHTIWSSTDINKRGEYLLEYIITNNIDICNKGCEPTFINSIRKEVLDLTLCSVHISENIKGWHVSNEVSLSDHRQILFQYEANEIITNTYRNPRKTNWDLYYQNLLNGIQISDRKFNSVTELEEASVQISQVIQQAFQASCSASVRSTSRDVSW